MLPKFKPKSRFPLPAHYAPRNQPYLCQRDALCSGWDMPGFGYFMEMGLGKTRVLIDNFCLLYETGKVAGLLVIASKSVYTNWTRIDAQDPGEIQSWMWEKFQSNTLVYTHRSGKSKNEGDQRAKLLAVGGEGPRILVVNVEALSVSDDVMNLCIRFLKAHPSMMVIDESTLIKNLKSIRTKTCLKLGALAAYRRILTGSPITKSPLDIFPQMQFLKPGCLGHRSYFTFRERYCKMKDIPINGRVIKVEVGVKNLEELGVSLAHYSYRALKKDCLDLPEKIYEPPRFVEMTEDQQRVYNEMRRYAMAQLDKADLKQGLVVADLPITLHLRLHQIVCGHVRTDDGRVMRLPENRSTSLMELLECTDESTIIWCNYRSDLQVILEKIRAVYGDDSVAQWHGDVPMSLRESGERDFQTQKRRFMLATQSSGARGRTWTAGSLVVYYSNSPDLELRLQSEDRPHRIGQKSNVTYIDIMTRNTVDEKIVRTLLARENMAAVINRDGARKWLQLE